MTSALLKIVMAEPYSVRAVARLREIGSVSQLTSCDETHLMEAVADCDALLIRTNCRVTRNIIAGAPRLRVIGRGGVGLDNVDLEAARERGITVVHTPHAATDAVADLTFGLLLSLVWRLSESDAGIRAGRFADVRASVRPMELTTLTLGIVGMGRIGKAVARRAVLGFGMKVVYNDLLDPGPMPFAVTRLEKDALYAESDVVSLHVPLTALTRNMVDESALAKFKPGTLLLNTSRGAVVNAKAVAEALVSGRLAGAGLDVFDPEPPLTDHLLLNAPNTVLTPHVGAKTKLAQDRMNDVVEDVIGVLKGLAPRFPAA